MPPITFKTHIVATDDQGRSSYFFGAYQMAIRLGGSPSGILQALRQGVPYRGLKLRVAKSRDEGIPTIDLALAPSTRGRRRGIVRDDGKKFASVTAAAAATGINKPDNIVSAIQRKGKSGGHLWAYAE